MMVVKVSAISTMVLLLAGCGGTPECREPQPYESSELGQHIEAPPSLDSLDPEQEMTIPDVSPRPPRPESAPCLEYPPSFQAPAPEENSDESEA